MHRSLFSTLADEWDRLASTPATRAQVRSWGLGVETLDGALGLIGYRWRGQDPATVVPAARAGVALRHLLSIAPADQLAARTILERLIPGLRAVARQRIEANAFDELVTAAWDAIVSFNPARRPANLPAALLGDCEYLAFRREGRRRRFDLASFDADLRPHSGSSGQALDELTVLVGEASRAGKLGERDLELLSNLLSGRSNRETAAAMKVCERTVRYHRNDLVDRLRQFALVA